jgi:hypothetical protein
MQPADGKVLVDRASNSRAVNHEAANSTAFGESRQGCVSGMQSWYAALAGSLRDESEIRQSHESRRGQRFYKTEENFGKER